MVACRGDCDIRMVVRNPNPHNVYIYKYKIYIYIIIEKEDMSIHTMYECVRACVRVRFCVGTCG